MASKLGLVKIVSPTHKHTGTIIFLHGSGDTGKGVREWIQFVLGKDFIFPHLRVVFPTAPYMPYTPLDGQLSNVWFDRQSISPEAPENLQSIGSMANELTELIKNEVLSGIAHNRIIIGGFSMGGAMAMHLGYRYLPQVAGVFALSAFLNQNSAVYQHLEKSSEPKTLPPLFMCHGERDALVPISWGDETFKKLSQLGVQGTFHPLKNTLHELKRVELHKLLEWIGQCLPETDE